MSVTQHCGLIIADSEQTVEKLITLYGFTGTHRILIEPGTVWECNKFSNENSHDIYVIILKPEEVQLLGNSHGIPLHHWVTTRISDILEIRKRLGVRTLDVEFDIIAVGTPNILMLHKHRGIYVSNQYVLLKEGKSIIPE